VPSGASVYDARVSSRAARRGAALVAVVALVAGCLDKPTAPPSRGVTPTSGPSGAPSEPPASSGPSPTAAAGISFPLAVVTGLTNLKATVTLDQLVELASNGRLLAPCGVRVDEPTLEIATPCILADDLASEILSNPDAVALLPPGLVEPATKVLPIAGDGPFGLFGPDLFGDPESRALPYPVQGSTTDDGTLDADWIAYDAAQVWTMTSIGSLCSDREAAEQAVIKGKGWGWVFGGGTARYDGPPIPNPNPPPGIDTHPIVRPIQTGNRGVVAEIQRRADVAIADHECPILPDRQWSPQSGGALSFAVPEAVVTEWQDTLGLDVVYLAANHMSDRGVAGIESTLRILDKHALPHTGLGMNLDQGLEPAFVDVAGLRVAFVAWNDVGGVARADEDTAGVPWITKENINDAVQRALDGGADVVMCDPQWWGGVEYHDDLYPKQVRQLSWFDRNRCDHVVGAGTHVAGPMLLRQRGPDVSLVLASPGNYVFGQDFWQNTSEGVILEQQFVGPLLVNVRLHPYVIIVGARPSLTDPEGDGHYVLERIWKNSDLRY
jgi:capsule synthesis protein PGA_cap